MGKRYREYEKYDRAYRTPSYRMGNNRKKAAQKAIKDLGFQGSYLDVACGRGEMVSFAKELGFCPAIGVDVVDSLMNESVIYGEAHNLPFNDDEFDVVTSFDAFEHFLPEDTQLALSEINRVSTRAVILCIALTPSMNMKETLHINLRTTGEWTELINRYIDGKAERLPKTNGTRSETWVIYKEEMK